MRRMNRDLDTKTKTKLVLAVVLALVIAAIVAFVIVPASAKAFTPEEFDEAFTAAKSDNGRY